VVYGRRDRVRPCLGDDLALIIYTSGTTGRSKGAMITHNNVLATVTGLLSAWAWEPDDRLLLCLPLFHVHGLIVGLHCALAAGATVLLRTRFDAASIVADLTSGEPTLFFAVPTIYVRLVDQLASLDQGDMGAMRLFCSGSAPLAAETHQAFEQLTGHTDSGALRHDRDRHEPEQSIRRTASAGQRGHALPGVSMRIVNRRDEDVPR
jgi:malonyl-CoA/methylmalonyl-CoA synthetase